MIYLDNAATTKPSKTAIEKASIFNQENYFNPSALYNDGIKTSVEIKNAKNYLLSTLGATNHEVIFNSCGTEADNQAIFCAVSRGIFVTSEGEHSAVYNSFNELKRRGLKVYFAPLLSDGRVDVDALIKFVKDNPETSFVSIVHVNNETGAINDINAIAKAIKLINKNIIFHSDGVQAYGKINYKITNDIDLYSISAHKINAIKGTGALVKKKGLNIKPLLFGGGQENNLRSGTENTFGIKVFEYASREHFAIINDKYVELSAYKSKMIEMLDKDLFEIISTPEGSPYILTVSAKGLRGEVIMHTLEGYGIIVGNGSACSSKHRYSRVLTACGYKNTILDGVIRISFSSETTIDEVVFCAEKLNETASKLKKIMR